ncbi:MAG TPA: hypothetical protein VGD34_10245 [Kribbella sp.]
MAFSGIEADGVLALSAATLATSGNLNLEAKAIQTLVGTVSDLVPDPPNVTARTNPVVEELARVSGWAKDIAIKFVDDQKPLQDLAKLGYWLPDFSKLGWDGSKSVGGNIDKTARSDEFGAFVLGTAGALLDRYRKWQLAVPKPGTPPLVLPPADDVVRGTQLIRRPSGLLVPQGSSADPNVARLAEESRGPGWQQPGRSLSPEGFGRPPTWARYGSKGLFVAGAALTLYDVGMSQWEHDKQYHPEWSTGQRVASTGYSVATEGGGAVAGGIVGASWGASIGTAIFPGAGTIVGGILGGAIGSFAGSKIGKAVGTGIKEGAKKVWHSLFG